MSNDFFKVKKGLNVKPTDPAEISNPQDGDIIVDSTDDNRMKVYDSVGGDFASVGTGGSSGNILSDIEKLTPVVSNVVATTDTVTFLPIDDNNKSVKAVFSGSDGSIRYEAPADASLDGVQGSVKVWIKTDVENLTLVATKDTVAQNNGLTVNSSGKWRQYEIPVVLGDADYGFEVQASGTVAGDVYIDEATVSVEQVVQQLGNAHFVGSLTHETQFCAWATASTSWSSLGVDSDCVASNIIGGIQIPDTNIPAIKIPNARTDGYYSFKYQGLLYKDQPDGSCVYSTSSTSSTFESQGTSYVEGGNGRSSNIVTGNFRFTTSGSKQIEVIAKRQSGTGTCVVYGDSNQPSKFTVHFYPDSNATIVTQDTELTADTANTFTGRLKNDQSGTTNHNFDIMTCSSSGTGTGVCVYSDPTLFSVPPSIQLTNFSGSGLCKEAKTFSNSATGFTFFSSSSAGAAADCWLDYTISRAGSDFNKSQTIIGKFENINSSELVKVYARNSQSETVTNSVTNIFFSEESDNTNSFDGRVFTAPRDSDYLFNVSVRASLSVLNLVSAWISTDGGTNFIRRYYVTDESTNNDRSSGSLILKLEAGDKVAFRADTNFDTLNGDPTGHYLQITELPDTESIIKNLSNQVTKCQTKYLSANVTTDGVMSDVTFSNLEVGKRYNVNTSFRVSETSTSSNEKYALIAVSNDAGGIDDVIADAYTRVTTTRHQTMFTPSKTFKAVDTSLTFNFTNVSNMQVAGNSTRYGWAELCELPDTYVETDEW